MIALFPIVNTENINLDNIGEIGDKFAILDKLLTLRKDNKGYFFCDYPNDHFIPIEEFDDYYNEGEIDGVFLCYSENYFGRELREILSKHPNIENEGI